ncbi:MAG: magnesium transporter [Phycisphaerales bacterium]|nr:MAG: magnesium transporter [Phycisphaerales bacterium]
MKSEIDSFHERIDAALDSGDDVRLGEELQSARAADIAESFELLGDEERSRILFALPPHTAAEVVVMLDEAVRGDVVEDLDTESLTELVSELTPDDAADFLGELSEEEVGEILDHMPDEESDKIEELLEYDEETAGGIMTPDVVAVSATATVADATRFVRDASQEEDLNEIYIVDEDQKPVGTVPLRRLVTNPPETKLAGICDRDPVVVFVGDDQETVIQIIRKYDAMEAVVVDANGRLLGRITHDDLLDVAEEEAAEDLLRMAGTDPDELETSSILQAVRIRLTWLLPCMLGMLLTASVLRISEPEFDVALFAALAIFVPMIGAMGGNSGIQISTVIVRGFATGELASTKLLRAFAREGRIALLMAPVCGLAAWGIVSAFFPIFESFQSASVVFGDHSRVALAVGTAMTSAILVAAFLGIALPFSFRRLGVDPAIASGPLVTTMNDVVSVTIYMILAMAIAQ